MLFFLLFFTQLAFADEIKLPEDRPFPVSIEEHKDVLDTGMWIVLLTHDLVRLELNEQRDLALLAMQTKTYLAKASSKESYQKSLLQYETSRLGVQELKRKIIEVKSQKIYYESRLNWKSEKRETAEYSMKCFKNWWSARLETSRARVEFAQKRYQINQVIFGIYKKLTPKVNIAEEEVVIATANARDSEEALIQAKKMVLELEKSIKVIDSITTP